MMHDKTLYIHIGSHKTGTTSIQQTLLQNEKALATQGIRYYCSNYFNGKNNPPDLHSWLCFENKGSLVPTGMNIREPETLAQKLAELDTDVIVSSENFSFLFEIAKLERLQQELFNYFPRIKVICYIRRQDRHLVSHHQEGSKLNRQPEHELFGTLPCALPYYENRHGLYLDYFQRLSMWADAFGDENMVIRVFEREKLKGGDVVKDFFALIGIDSYERIDRSNESMGFKKTKLGHILNNSEVVNKSQIADLLISRLGGSDKMLPSRHRASEYYAHYRSSNEMLNRRFKISKQESIFSEDFDFYPEMSTDAWTEDSTNEFVAEILGIIDDTYGGIDAVTLRNAAIRCEKENLGSSYKLMSLAHKLKPQGKLIQRKLDLYRERLAKQSDQS